MCGICGVVRRDKISEKELSAVREMNEIQRFRGPDDEGLENFGLAVLGHRRLSFLDLSSAGHQPMGDASGRFQIVFNGEIYNFQELRKGLQGLGVGFKTQSDTEVILELYVRDGSKMLSKLRGMFALAIWDTKENMLFLARDRYGIKPLYYSLVSAGDLVFASTVKAIKGSGLVSTTSDIGAKIGFVVFGSIPAPYTTYKEISSLPAGSFAEYVDGILKVEKYYDALEFFINKKEVPRVEAVEKIKNLLVEATKLHLISDAPLGVFLSGGLDSSALSALAVKVRGVEPIDTLGIDFEEKDFSEKEVRKLVVEKIKTRHREIMVREKDLVCELPNIMMTMDQPTIDGVNSYFVSAAAKLAGLKAVLSGLGSDEIFMGYHYFQIANKIRLIQKLVPNFIWKLWPRRGKWGRLQWLKNKNPFFAYVSARSIFSPIEAAELVGVPESEVWSMISSLSDSSPRVMGQLVGPDLFSYLDLSFYMHNQLLRDTDFMSMKHSVEVRVPFLDHKLVEYVSSLPISLKLGGNKPKSLLIEAVEGLLPKEVWERKKMGFTFPFAEWLKNKDYFPGRAERARQEFLAGGHWSRYWMEIVNNSFKS
jgi:asparagine synthase (glutamine-hydrolysing)